MPVRTGGDMPDPIDTETEYAGKILVPNTVGDLGPAGRKLSSAEKKRLGLLTGQDVDPYAERQDAFMGGVDSNFIDPSLTPEMIEPETEGRTYVE